jgi:hypothetical protein
MSRAGAHIRSEEELVKAVGEAWDQVRRIEEQGCACGAGSAHMSQALKNRYLCFAHAVYLEAVLFAVRSGVGSRGSAIVVDANGTRVHDKLDDSWCVAAEDASFREKVQETGVLSEGRVESRWVSRRPMPVADAWFETAWASFRNGRIYG